MELVEVVESQLSGKPVGLLLVVATQLVQALSLLVWDWGAQPREIFLTAAELQARPLYLKIAPWILLACYEPTAAGCRQ